LILHLHGWVALLIIFALPALEASAFLGFVFPGEIAVLLGGVLAYEHRISLPAAILAAVLGAIIGDTAGYFVGRRWGRHILRHTVGRLPFIKHRLDDHLEQARQYLQRKGGRALLVGRFTAALRVLIPGLAGMSEMHYPTFLLWNAIGGIVWGTTFVLLGFVAGASYRHVAGIASKVGFGLLAAIVIWLVAWRFLRDSARWQRRGNWLAALPPLAWMRRRYPRQVTWLWERLNLRQPTGFALTLVVLLGMLSLWAFGGLTQDVVANDEVARVDPTVTAFIVAHRAEWVTTVLRTFTWLGSSVVLVPLVLVTGGYFYWRDHHWRPLLVLTFGYLGAVAFYELVKSVVAQARPPLADRIGPVVSGHSFPSGHATQAMAVWGMLAIVTAVRSPRARIPATTAAVLIILLVGLSRLYLGVHWLSDVLAGYALGGVVLTTILAAVLMSPWARSRKWVGG
jgi:membrane protein DedA with SNARE-associated domain/membrane-associated phospholipid phosphatase